MPLETASTIADLVATNPVGNADSPAALDDHIRLIKTVLKADALVEADKGAANGVATLNASSKVVQTALLADSATTATTATDATNVTGAATSAFALTADITPTQITANTNDYAPTGLSTANTLRLSTDASRDLTGLTGGSDGRLMIVHNVGSNALVLKNESASSTAANRFALGGADVTLAANQSVTLQYDATASRWRLAFIAVQPQFLVVKQAVDSTDITLNDIASSYNNFGSAFTATIPASGVVRVVVSGRLRADAAAAGQLYVGLRIGSTNYWFGAVPNRVTSGISVPLVATPVMQTGATLNDYTEWLGEGSTPLNGGISLRMNIAAAGLPAGSQTVQVVVARADSAASLRGTTTTSRVVISIEEAS